MLRSCWCVITHKQYCCSPITSAPASLHKGYELLQSKHTGKHINTHFYLRLLQCCFQVQLYCHKEQKLFLCCPSESMLWHIHTSFLLFSAPLTQRTVPFSVQFPRCYKPQIHCHNQGSQDNISETNCPILWQKEWIFLTTLPSCNLRIPADVHNRSLALVAMEIVSGKLQRQTEREKCGGEVEWQTAQSATRSRK